MKRVPGAKRLPPGARAVQCQGKAVLFALAINVDEKELEHARPIHFF